jgi:hypothetical protein
MPPPSRTGTSSTSTRSTCLAPSRLRNRLAPPNSQISRRGRSAEGGDAWTRLDPYDRHAGVFLRHQCSGEDVDLPALRPRGRARLAGEFIGAPAQEHGVDPLVDLREVHRGLVHDPIHLAVGPGDVPVNTRGNAVEDSAQQTSSSWIQALPNDRQVSGGAAAAARSVMPAEAAGPAAAFAC